MVPEPPKAKGGHAQSSPLTTANSHMYGAVAKPKRPRSLRSNDFHLEERVGVGGAIWCGKTVVVGALLGTLFHEFAE